MGERKEAVVVGALGVIGRYIVERLLRQDDWSVIVLSRRATVAGPVTATSVSMAENIEQDVSLSSTRPDDGQIKSTIGICRGQTTAGRTSGKRPVRRIAAIPAADPTTPQA